MGETKKVLFARNLICVCVEDDRDGDLQGELWHQYSDDPIVFNSVADMLVGMDALYDHWDFPQKALENREFYSSKRSEELPQPDKLVIDEIQKKFGTRNIQNKKGSLGTFVVQVSYRQKATWQGRVIYSEENEQYDFASAKALVELMDQKVHEGR